MAKVSGNAGLVLFGSAATITGATGTTTITVTCTNSFTAGDRIYITGILGMTDLNGSHTIVSRTSGNFTVTLSEATSQTYTSGGTATNCCDITEWTFDKKTDIQDVTDSGIATGYKSFLPNNWVEGEGTFAGFFQTGTTQPSFGTSVTITLKINSTNYYSGTGYIISNGTSLEIMGTSAVKVNYSFKLSGSYSLTVA